MSDLISISNLSPIKRVEKVWGEELWLVNEPGYCSKILVLNQGYQCSKHYHPIKNETFIILHGSARIECGFTDKVMIVGDTLTIPAGTPHRFSSRFKKGVLGNQNQKTIILEISTHHDDADVVRLEDSREIDDDNNFIMR